jgi:site-specific DNA-adenine methylase
MSFKIPSLEGYFGGKAGSGTYQQIINIIPPHRVFGVPFLGHCGITRNIKKASVTILNDFDSTVTDAWYDYLPNLDSHGWFIHNTDFRIFLDLYFSRMLNKEDTVIYCDPPYLRDTCLSNHKYNVELTNADHLELLEMAKKFKNAKVLISTYDNDMYQNELKGWNKIQFQSRTRAGVATETVYFNYEKPTKLHDYWYFGNDYKEREQYLIKKNNLIAKFDRMTPLEQNYFADALKTEFKTLFNGCSST